MLARSDLVRDFDEVQGHRLGIAAGRDECCSLAVVRATCSEDVGGGGALIVRGAGSCPASGPAPRDLVLLADPRFVLEPDLYRRALRESFSDLCQLGGKAPFLKASIASSFWA